MRLVPLIRRCTLIVITIVVGIVEGKAQDRSLEVDSIINFFEGSFEEANKITKDENLGFFVFVWSDSTEVVTKHWQSLFVDSNVVSLFNERFVNYNIHKDSAKGMNAAKQFDVKVFPAAVFVDSYGQVLYDLTGSGKIEADQLVERIQRSVLPELD